MQMIQDDIRSVTSTYDDANWPVTNVLDEHPRNIWRTNGVPGSPNSFADYQTDTIVATVAHDQFSSVDALYIGNTTATECKVTVRNAADNTDLVSEKSINLIGTNFFTSLTQKYLETYTEAWYSFNGQNEDVIIKIELTTSKITDLLITDGGTGYSDGVLTASSGDFFGTYKVDGNGAINSVRVINGGSGYSSRPTITISNPGGGGRDGSITSYSRLKVGIVRAGYAKEFRNPEYGMGETFVDYSIVKKYHNGTEYYKQRDTMRVFSGTSTIDLDSVSQYHNLLRQSRRYPTAWNILNGEQRGVLFGRITQLPNSSRVYLNSMRSDFAIEEVL